MGRKTSINAIIIRYLPLLSDACSRSFNAKAVGFYRKGRGLLLQRPWAFLQKAAAFWAPYPLKTP